MKATKKEEAAMWECYRRLYKASEPSADFDELLKDAPTNERGQKVIDFMAYEIDEFDYIEIVNGIIKEFKIKPEYRADLFKRAMLLGASPKFKRRSEKLTYEERVQWFVSNFYETGMEYEAMLDNMKNQDLDNFEWYGDIVKIPKYKTQRE
jgi:hypothetical protein